MRNDNLFCQLEEPLGVLRGKVAVTEGNVETTYGDFERLIDVYSVRLSKATEYGSVVGVKCTAKTHSLAAMYACFQTGRTAVCLQSQDREVLERTIADAGISFVLSEGEWRSPSSRSRTADRTRSNDPAIIVYTSGTTGHHRKGVLVSHACIGNAAAFMNDAMNVTTDIDEILVAPIDHLYGLGRCHAVLSAGGTLNLTSNFVTVFEILARGGNSLGVIPSVIATLLMKYDEELRNVGQSVKWIQTGAMRLEQDYRRLLLDVFPTANIFMHYGLTEVMRATFLNLRGEQHKIHTEGRPRPGVNIQILDDKGNALPACAKGEIWIGGNALAMGYTDPQAWHTRLRNGQYRTGDIGSFDEDGYLLFHGRNDDVMNVNGNLVHPDEVETRLAGLVTSPICVVGLPDPHGVSDHILVLCVEGEQNISRRQVVAYMSGAERHLVPEYVRTVNPFPRTETGKVKRRELSKIVAQSVVSRS